MINNKSTKFKIELTAKTTCRQDLAWIYEQITILVDSTSNLLEFVDINSRVINNEDVIPRYTGKYEGDPETKDEDIKESINDFKNRFYSNNQFDDYINSLDTYSKPKEGNPTDYIKDYLIKRREGRLGEIIKGSEEQGFNSNVKNTSMKFVRALNKLVDSGKVNKEGIIYSWNYDSEDE